VLASCQSGETVTGYAASQRPHDRNRALNALPRGINRNAAFCRAFLAQRRGATHSGESGKLDRRDGELKMDWTKPPHDARGMGVEWSADSCMDEESSPAAKDCRVLRIGGHDFSGSEFWRLKLSALPDEIGYNKNQGFPTMLAEPNRYGARLGECDDAAHEVFLMAGGLCGVSVSTMIMRPRRQTGHSRNEDPVSCSCWSR
jgi:hypothetical protein